MACGYTVRASRRQTRDPDAVRHQLDDGRLGAASGIEPAMLVRVARTGGPGQTPPTPELGEVEPWPSPESADDGRPCSPRAGDAEEQSVVLAPVRKDDWT